MTFSNCARPTSQRSRLSVFNLHLARLFRYRAFFCRFWQSLLPLLSTNSRALVAVGDPKQLAPVIARPVTTTGADGREKSHGLGRTLFSRLEDMGVNSFALDKQYRCHPTIARICIKLFYNGELQSGCTFDDRAALVPELAPVCFVESKGSQSIEKLGSISNVNEATLVTKTVHCLIRFGIDSASIGVICYYKAQADLIQKALVSGEGASKDVMVSTVDAFQGAERDIILISLACERAADFIDQQERLNVAVSRAKHHLIVFANQTIPSQSSLWAEVVRLGRAALFKTVPAPIMHARAREDPVREEVTSVDVIMDSDDDGDECVLVSVDDKAGAGGNALGRTVEGQLAATVSDFSTIDPRQLWEGYKSFWLGFTYGDEGSKRQFLESALGRKFLSRFEGRLPRKNLNALYTNFYVAARDDVSLRHGETSVRLEAMISKYDDEESLRGTVFGACVLEVRTSPVACISRCNRALRWCGHSVLYFGLTDVAVFLFACLFAHPFSFILLPLNRMRRRSDLVAMTPR